jgi:uncharacterized protein (DUF305 family)
VKRAVALVGIAAAIVVVVAAPFLWNAAPAGAQSLDSLSGEEFEKAFLHEMIMHHAMAVQMVSPIPEKAVHEELKAAGQSVVTSQAAEIQRMRGWLKDWYGVDMPMMDGQGMMPGMHQGQGHGMMPGMHQGAGNGMMPGMGPGMMQGQGMGAGMMDMQQCMQMHQGMAGMMAELSGPRLEATFMSMMIPHHEGAVAMARLATERAVHPELKQLAEQIVADQSREIGQFNQWLADWYSL